MRLARGHFGTRPRQAHSPAGLSSACINPSPDSGPPELGQVGLILPTRGAPSPAAMAAAGPAAGLAALDDAAEVDTLTSNYELYGWAELDGDLGDPPGPPRGSP